MSQQNQEHKIPSWLQRIQENSSELELLISGGAIYGLLQTSDAINQFIAKYAVLTSKFSEVGGYIYMFKVIVSMLLIGFISHLIVRAYWLALVCLNYVYPEGINFDKIKLQKPYFINPNKRNDLYNEIVKADKICGLILYTSIAACILFAGIIIYMMIVSVLDVYFLNDLFDTKLFLSISGYSLLIYILDLVLSGLFRKIPYFSYITYPFFKILDFLTLRFIVQKSLWKFSSNSNIIKRTLLVALFVVLSFCYTLEQNNAIFDERDYPWVDYEAYKSDVSSYRDDNNNYAGFNWPSRYTIQSKLISDNFIRLQILYTYQEHEYLQKNDCEINKLYNIKINNTIIENTSWSRFQKNNHLSGIEFIIPIDAYSKGHHMLSIYDESNFTKVETTNDQGETEYIEQNGKEIIIPFWYDKLAANKK